MNFIPSLHWRYSVKKFDFRKKLSKRKLQKVLTAVNLSASSYGMQPYKIVVVSDDAEVRKELRFQSFNQPQITDASHLLIFAIRTDINKNYVEDMVKYIEKKRGLMHGTLDGYKTTVIKNIDTLSTVDKVSWATNQAYIALGTLITYCAFEKIDTCPMEGFSREGFEKILNFTDKNLKPTVLAAIGYRAIDDSYRLMKKVRKPLSEMVFQNKF